MFVIYLQLIFFLLFLNILKKNIIYCFIIIIIILNFFVLSLLSHFFNNFNSTKFILILKFSILNYSFYIYLLIFIKKYLFINIFMIFMY